MGRARRLMLAYRHAFHAGNHADVLKHIVLMLVLRHMNAKAKAYRFVDTHAGAGGYSLEGRYAQKKGEYERGIGRLWTRDDLPEPVADYVALVRRFNPDGVLAQYPGSPALAQMLLRAAGPAARLRAASDRAEDPARDAGGDAGARPTTATASSACKSQLPPSSRRGAVLIDPSYEGNGDYGRVVATLREALARFADGRLHGLVSAGAASSRRRSCRGGSRRWRPRAGCTPASRVQQPDAQGFGLAGSGMFVINPPHTLHAPARRPCCPAWSTCSASTTAPTSSSIGSTPEPRCAQADGRAAVAAARRRRRASGRGRRRTARSACRPAACTESRCSSGSVLGDVAAGEVLADALQPLDQRRRQARA